MSKNIMINLLKEIEKYPLLCSWFATLNDEQKSKFLTAMRYMNRGMLYKSPIHGEYHSEKVTLFCFLLGVKLGCTDRELDILIDAGMYHDFMRDSDNEDCFHGLGSANNIGRIIPRGKYTQDELSILKSIMDFHSTDIKLHDYRSIAENHDVNFKDMDRAEILAFILRDADALDRCRFSKESIAYLKPEYLAYPESHDLIKLSEEINEAYLGKMFTDEEILSNKYLHRNRAKCLHSVGQNLFRVNSVLEHGLLSYSRFSQLDPAFQRNFDGGNCDKWISVVPSNMITKGSGASKEFLKNGVVFLFDETDLYYPDEKVNSSYARSYGLPYTKNAGYSDEQYAFDFIPKEKIIGVCLDKELSEKSFCGLQRYVYDSFNYDLFEKNVMFYLNKLNLIKDGVIPSNVKELLDDYKKITKEAEDKSLLLQDLYADKLMKVSRNINIYIGYELSEYYRKKLGMPEDAVVTLHDALLYELRNSNYEYERMPGDNVFYMLTPKVDTKRRRTYL